MYVVLQVVSYTYQHLIVFHSRTGPNNVQMYVVLQVVTYTYQHLIVFHSRVLFDVQYIYVDHE
jgi:hypothetical protein